MTIGTTQYLLLVGFGFTLPANVSIDGIRVDVDRKSEYSTENQWIKDHHVRLVRNYVIGEKESASSDPWEDDFTVAQYGGLGEKWGHHWTSADVGDPGFGVAISAHSSMAGIAYVRSVRLVVFYSVLNRVTKGSKIFGFFDPYEGLVTKKGK